MILKKYLYLKYIWFSGIKNPIIWQDKFISFEQLSHYYTVLLQTQIATSNLTWCKFIKALLKHYIVSPIKGYWYKFKYNIIGIPIIWYTGYKKGTFINSSKLPVDKNNMKWTKHVLIKGKKTQYKTI